MEPSDGARASAAVLGPRQVRAQWPMVAIVGRPNVGKSSLFNRLVGHRQAIVSEELGTTRDRISGQVTTGDRTFLAVDTGGLEVHVESPLWAKVRAQGEAAIRESDVVVFVTDVTQGVMPDDWGIADLLRRSGRPVILVANKADGPAWDVRSLEMYELGLGEPLPVSAYHNRGAGALLDRLRATLPPLVEPPAAQPNVLRLAIVGRPNVGKSLLANAILGQERAIVSEEPGTTRDALDTPMVYRDQPVVLIDTAGIRRRGRVAGGIEWYSVLRSVRAIARSDVVVVVLDATEMVTAQDSHVAGLVVDSLRGVVVAVNKWDLARESGLDQAQAGAEVQERLKFMRYAPVHCVSALRRQGIEDLMDTALAVYRERARSVPASELQDVVMGAVAAHPPPQFGPRGLRIYRVTQEGVNPPTFAFSINSPKYLHFSYKRYLENTLRRAFGFRGTPLGLEFRGRRGSRASAPERRRV